MCQKLPDDCFKWENPKDLHSDLPFLSKRMKIDKSDKLICNF